MKKYFLLIVSAFTLVVFASCAPKVAYQAQDSMQAASLEASSQAARTKKGRVALNKNSYRMKGDIKRIKEAERLFDVKSGIVLSY